MEEIPMKRLALVLAAAVLGTGCHSSSPAYTPPPTGVDFAWSFVRVKADGSTASPYGCTTAGVDNVIVSFPGADVQVPCADSAGDGALIVDVSTGTYAVTITGRRGSAALYSGQTTVTVVAGQVTSTSPQVYGIPDDLDIYAHFLNQTGTGGWATCALANVATLGYAIVDWAGTVVASGTTPCTDPAGLSFTGASALDRDNYVIRLQGFEPSATTEAFDSATTAVSPTCSGQAFNHFSADTGAYGWDVDLFDVTANGTICN
jgi:hypothetical protein